MATNLVAYPSKSGFWLKVEFPDDFLVLNQNNPLHSGFHGTQTALIPSIISCCTNNTGFLLLLYHTCFTWAFLQDIVPITDYSDHHLLPLLFKYFNILMEFWGHQDSFYSGVSDTGYKPHFLFPHSLPYFTLKEVSFTSITVKQNEHEMEAQPKRHFTACGRVWKEDACTRREHRAISQAL